MVEEKEERYQGLQEYLESPEGETAKKEFIRSVIKLVEEEEGFESAKKLFSALEYAERYGKYLSNKLREKVKKSSLKEERKIDYLKIIPESRRKIYKSSGESLVDIWDRFTYEVETREKEKIKKHGKTGGKQQ